MSPYLNLIQWCMVRSPLRWQCWQAQTLHLDILWFDLAGLKIFRVKYLQILIFNVQTGESCHGVCPGQLYRRRTHVW